MIDFIAGMLIACLAGMGIGGGGLLVLYLVFVKEMGQLEAQGLNLIFFICAAVASLLYHRKKRKINYRLAAIISVFGVIGAVLGSLTASMLEPDVIRQIFGWLLTVSGGMVLLGGKKKNKKEK